ncbi:MAG: hypothetical protein HY327_04900, partial [Chloroflexi bacterium]|nr:hypothetical protein [Chloroflexota bacterium]
GWQSGRTLDFLIAGIVLGISIYTYLSAFTLPLLLVALIAHQIIFARRLAIVCARGAALTFATGLAVAAPLLVFEISYPYAAFFRASQVTLFQHPDFERIGAVGVLALKLFSQMKLFGIEWEGQYNPLAQPLLDPLWFALFGIGLLACLSRVRDFRFAWALIAIAVMLLPDMIGGNELFPQELRVIGIIPPTLFVAAIGATTVFNRIQRPGQIFLAVVFLAFSGVRAAGAYFNEWASLARKADHPDFNLTEVAEGKWIAQTNAPLLVPLNEYARQPVRFLTAARAKRLRADAEIISKLPDSVLILFPEIAQRPRFEGRIYANDPAAFVLIHQDSVYVLPPLEEQFAAGLRSRVQNNMGEPIRNSIGEIVARAYPLDPRLLQFSTRSLNHAIKFEDTLTLSDFSINANRVQPGEPIPLTLWWSLARKSAKDYTIFVHLLSFRGEVVSSADVIPALGAFPTFLWQPGERVPTHHQLPVPLRTPPGKYWIEVGLYNSLDQTRLDLLDLPGESRVIVGAVKIAPRQAVVYNPAHLQRGEFDSLGLIGYDVMSTPNPHEFRVATYWQARAAMPTDYSLFVHALDARGEIIAQADHQPQSGNYPTSIWDAGEIVRDEFSITLPPGKFNLVIGWYDLNTGARLGRRDASGDSIILDTALESR